MVQPQERYDTHQDPSAFLASAAVIRLTPLAVLAWSHASPPPCRIPYVEENVATAEIALTESELAELGEGRPGRSGNGRPRSGGADVDARAGSRAPKLLDRRTNFMAEQPGTQADTRTALVTGGGTGIGRAASLALAAAGYSVTVAGRIAATLEDTVKLVSEAGGKAKYGIADVHDEDAIRPSVEVAAGELGRLDVAVNSAGVDGGKDSHPFIDYPVETLDLMLATNVRGMFFSMKHELVLMAKQGFGPNVNISSGAGLTGVPGYAGYVASPIAACASTPCALAW
jgi:hypothetical protein